MQFLFLLTFSLPCLSQKFHDLGALEKASSKIDFTVSNSQFNVFATSVFNSPIFSDTSVSIQKAYFNRQLVLDSTKELKYRKHIGFLTLDFAHPPNFKNYILSSYWNPNKQGFKRLFNLSKVNYCKLNNDSITDCISILPDSAYLRVGEIDYLFTLPNNDTIYTILEYTLGRLDSVPKQYVVKLDTISGHVNRKELQLTNQGKNIALTSSPLLLNNGNLFFTAIQYNSMQQVGVAITLNLSFNNIQKIRSTVGSHKVSGVWQKGNKVIIFTRNARYDPTVLTQVVFEGLLEVIDLVKDTISERYFFPSNPKSIFPSGNEFAGPGTYFNGEYFVLAETVNQDSGTSRNYKTTLFAVDTNFKVISSKTITNSNKLYYGRVSSFIPDPDTPHTYIYCGDADNFPLTNSDDIMLGRFKVNANGIDMPEVNFRKAEVYFYPNPSSTYVDVLIGSEKEETYQLEFYNQKGQKVLEAKANGRKTRLPHNLATGVYTVVATAGTKREVLNLVVE